jgi:phosphate:Na+ symporter
MFLWLTLISCGAGNSAQTSDGRSLPPTTALLYTDYDCLRRFGCIRAFHRAEDRVRTTVSESSQHLRRRRPRSRNNTEVGGIPLATMISILGGVGLFLLGMAVMTDGLKGLAGSALRGVLAKAAATSLSGTFWGAVITLLVQSSSATTMTTIGLVSAGLLTFPQGLSLVFGANIGTTGTGWLVALLGVRVSLTAAALPIVFVGALLKLLGRGRWAGAGSAIAGFALILVGLTTLQQGMGGLAEQLHPADLPSVLGEAGVTWWSGILGVLVLVVVGIVMTTVMQSSTAAIAVTLSALYTGAVGLDQAVALVIGQNIGTATSSAMAAVGASSTAKRLAVAYIAFKLTAALVALLLFPLVVRLMLRASNSVDSVTLLAAYHTGYNVVGVAILLPLIGPFTRLIERIVPERGSIFARYLDPASLAAPTVAVAAVRRTVARVLEALCSSVAAWLRGVGQGGTVRAAVDGATISQASDALQQARVFLSKVTDSSASEKEHRWFTSTLHALDHALRLAEAVDENVKIEFTVDGADERCAAALCAKAMRSAAAIAAPLARPPETASLEPQRTAATSSVNPIDTGEPLAVSAEKALEHLGRCSHELADLRRTHRRATLNSVASGTLTANDAIARVEAVRHFERLAHHAWRVAAHLAGASRNTEKPALEINGG